MAEKQIDDKIHRVLVNEFVSLIKRKEAGKKRFQIEIEKPYNFYGARGFIDVYFSYPLGSTEYDTYDTTVRHSVCEYR